MTKSVDSLQTLHPSTPNRLGPSVHGHPGSRVWGPAALTEAVLAVLDGAGVPLTVPPASDDVAAAVATERREATLTALRDAEELITRADRLDSVAGQKGLARLADALAALDGE